MEENKEQKVESVPFIVHDAALARMERQIKRLFTLCIVIFSALIVTNIGWIIYESQFEDISMTQEATTDGGGDAIINGTATGDLNNYGKSETDNQSSP